MTPANYHWVLSRPELLVSPVVDVGSYRVDEQADLRFQIYNVLGKEYFGVDMREGPNVTHVCDATQRIPFDSNWAGTVVCLDMLEHCDDFFAAAKEMFRILRPDGHFFAATVMNFPIHEYPNDYWRFTPSGMTYLLSKVMGLEEVEVTVTNLDGRGTADFPCIIRGVGKKTIWSPALEQPECTLS